MIGSIGTLMSTTIAASLTLPSTMHSASAHATPCVGGIATHNHEDQRTKELADPYVQRLEDELFSIEALLASALRPASACAEVVAHDASTTAEAESSVMSSRVNTLVDKLEEKHSSTAAIAAELVHGFLLPEVQRLTDKRLADLEESKFSNASRRALASAIDAVEARLNE